MTNSHWSLWLSLSICIHCVSHHLLRLIQIMNTLWQTGAVLFRVYETLSIIRWTFVGSLLFNLHLCHGHMHLEIIALLKFVFIQLGSSCATLSDKGGSRRAFWILGSRNLCGQWKKTHLLCLSWWKYGDCDCFCSINISRAQAVLVAFLAWLSHRKNKGWEGRKGNIKRTLSIWSCVYVHAWGGKRNRNSKGAKIKREWKVGGK